mgnify:CR=1 FL=1
MRSLKGYLSEAAGKNTHMTHIEDLILDGGVKGARQAILALRSLRDMLSGSAKSATDVTVKWIVIGAGFGTSVRTFNRQ